MKSNRFLSYAIAFIAGVGLWWSVPDNSSQSIGTEIAKPIFPKRNVSSAADVIDSRLNNIKTEQKRWQDRITKTTVREQALEIIHERAEVNRKNLEKLAQLKVIANGLKHTKDLRPALYSALVANDADYALGIFLEWHRRNPAEAFDEMAKRPEWFFHFCWETSLLYELQPSEIISQINHPKRSDEFSWEMIGLLATHLATQDHLADLATMWDSISEPHQYEALSYFADSWVPSDGNQAADFLLNKTSEDFRNQLFEHLLQGIPNPKNLWTDDFSQALLSQPLGSLENKREEIKEEAERISNTLGDFFYFPRDDANSRFEPTENATYNARYMTHSVETFLLHRKDYPQLFQNGLIDLDQIREAMIQDMPAAAGHGKLLDAALFENLLFHDPAKVMQWASVRIPAPDLATLCATRLGDFRDSRAEKSFQLLEAISPTLVNQSPELAEQ